MATAAVKHPRLISVREFAAALVKAGILETAEGVRRIVLDADSANVPVLLYIEYYADEKWLDVALTLDGVEIRTSEAPHG